jgi:hypothetical protein
VPIQQSANTQEEITSLQVRPHYGLTLNLTCPEEPYHNEMCLQNDILTLNGIAHSLSSDCRSGRRKRQPSRILGVQVNTRSSRPGQIASRTNGR